MPLQRIHTHEFINHPDEFHISGLIERLWERMQVVRPPLTGKNKAKINDADHNDC
jgi:hypothetical protein